MKFEVVRYEYYPDRTLGRLNIDDQFYCHTLEDKVRPEGIKVDGETAIPEGTYKVVIAPFRGNADKMYPHLQDVPMFTGICIHGGNKPEDTLGCILVGFSRNGLEIFSSAVLPLVKRMQEAGTDLEITIRNGG